jgi:hypothetical protein
MSTLRDLISGIEENNSINNAKWSDWEDLPHIESIYGNFSDPDITRDEANSIIANAIASDGASLVADLSAMERVVMGQNFAGSWWDRS